jgi:hypothetical protein
MCVHLRKCAGAQKHLLVQLSGGLFHGGYVIVINTLQHLGYLSWGDSQGGGVRW